MRNRYRDADADEALKRWADAPEAVAMRTYTARLLGAEPELVLHGGGNTSVKAPFVDDVGQTREALYVKGSGWDLAAIEPPGHPAVDLDRLRALRPLASLTDEAMVNAHRTRLFDASAPNPSVETLLHAFLPHRFIDHSHANAIVALCNLDDGPRHVRAALGDAVAIVPYVMPGFSLAKAAAEIYEAHPDVQGLVLLAHGLFTFGDTARESYDRHIDLVSRAEAYLREHAPDAPVAARDLTEARARARTVLPALRGALQQRWILAHRVDAELLDALERPDLARFAVSGPLTPDHVIRTKAWPLLVPDGDFAGAVERYHARYRAYFEAHAGDRALAALDPDPRVAWVPGAGIFGIGKTARDAHIAADIAEHTLRVKRRTAALGAYRGLPDPDLFAMEYWSLEQAKLGRKPEPPLARKVAWITGGAGAIGTGIARELLDAGAHVVLVDRDARRLAEAVDHLADPRVHAVSADITSERAVEEALGAAVERFGGVDLLVLGAGIATVAPIAETPPAAFDAVVSVNLGGVHRCLAAGARLFQAQGRGGDIVLVSSKNVLGPGASFGAYSASKAAAHQLCKVAALELAPAIRVNMVAPDAVFAEGPVRSGLWETVGPDRARSKGLSPEALAEHYRQRNLLKAPVTGRDVGRAVLFFALRSTPTTGATLPVDGGVPGAFPR